jgi:hypothetical protein
MEYPFQPYILPESAEILLFRSFVCVTAAALELLFLPMTAGRAEQMPSTPGTRVSILYEKVGNLFPEHEKLKSGTTVSNPLKLSFEIDGMKIAKAGTNEPGTGHFHLFIDTTLQPSDYAKAIPVDGHHIHFGAGQTDAVLTLEPGEHTLQLVLGDGFHVPHNPPVVSEVIAITVQ